MGQFRCRIGPIQGLADFRGRTPAAAADTIFPPTRVQQATE